MDQMYLFDPGYADTSARWRQFDAEHPCVWRDFVRIASTLKACGVKRYPARDVAAVVRYERLKLDEDVRIVGELLRYYVAKWRREYPRHRGLFRLRKRGI